MVEKEALLLVVAGVAVDPSANSFFNFCGFSGKPP